MSQATGSSYSLKVTKASQKESLGIAFNTVNDEVRVAAIDPTGPLASTALKEGDRILAVNGMPSTGKPASYTAAVLRKSKGDVEILVSFDEEDNSMRSADNSMRSAEHPEPVETDYLIVEESKAEESPVSDEAASSMSLMIGQIIFLVQVGVGTSLFLLYDYGSVDDFSMKKYSTFRDIMVMLLLGFGYLMTFLEKYGLSSVGLTMLLTALNMECNLVVESMFTGHRVISLDAIIDAEFSAATLLISFGALIGRATPLQMCALSLFQSVFYAANKVFLVFGYFGAEDVGGTMTIHMFGAFFGLAAAYALGPQNKPSASNNAASKVSDVFAFVGTTLLWVYWPSFVGATETASDRNEMLCLTNTIMALIGSTGATFYLSQELNKGKFDAVHIQNSTLAGGVAIGSTARLAMGPGTALIVGMVAGAISVLGYFYGSPFLEKKLGLYDTCGVANLHGLPSVLGGLLSVVMVYVYQPDAAEDILQHEVGTQSVMQLAAVVGTLVVAIGSGYMSGSILLPSSFDFEDYEDAVWWIMED